MALILNIETSSKICSVALGNNGVMIDLKETSDDYSHSEKLGLLIDMILKSNNFTAGTLDAIAVSMGPGSYTGLRIGISTAKGLCYGADKPLIAVNTLQSMTNQVIRNKFLSSIVNSDNSENALYCPMLDARRMEVYTAIFDKELNLHTAVSAMIIDDDSFNEILNESPVLFFGTGAEKCKSIIKHKNAFFIDNIVPSASGMVILSDKKFRESNFEDTAYFEPFYLKDFIAGKPRLYPKKLGLQK
ncbi:MAG: tRNA (adenosine(37)-N6)-threonylcarbamoyltransferase complex dimerization subunit type 1 TsaB [Bacteroidia bacterium]|nr:tRNA (adenosine(37)-N6)-threonylcarbamoyltransferase complex dimerization subunit type 1 TsaB [Bacteroidia bacterium]